MVEQSKITAALRKYAAGSEEFSNMTKIKNEMETIILDSINSTYSDREVEIAKKYRDNVMFQKDISLEYELDISWEFRNFVSSSLNTIKLAQVDKPAVILSIRDIEENDSELKKENEELYTELNKLFKKLKKYSSSLNKKLHAIKDVLSDKSMNITSIKKYYPELYKLMS
jgi:hypothetical protein